MYKVRFTKAFKKSYRLMEKRGFNIKLLDEVIEQLIQGNEFDSKYHNHMLAEITVMLGGNKDEQ